MRNAKTGELHTLEGDFKFVEIVDGTGKVACAVFQDQGGSIRVEHEGTPQWKTYLKTFDLKPSKTKIENE